MKREDAIIKIMEMLENDNDLLNDSMEALDSYNGYLGDDRYYLMEELDEFYHETDPLEILRMAFYGYDEMYTDKNGNHNEPFNPNREYFTFNGYGNLVSNDYKDYTGLLSDYFIEQLIDNANHLFLHQDIREIIENID